MPLYIGEEEVTIDQRIFLIDAKNSGENIQLQFGKSLAEMLEWSVTDESFLFTDDLIIEGNLEVQGNILDTHGNSGREGEILVAREDGKIEWNPQGNVLTPFVTTKKKWINPGETRTLTIRGKNFSPETEIMLSDFDGSIDEINIFSPESLSLTITAGLTDSLSDIILRNGTRSNLLWGENGKDFLITRELNWIDLREGGTNLTVGNGEGNDIRHRSGMTMNRDEKGMYFTGINPWQSWVKFSFLEWERGEKRNLEWIFSNNASYFMIGVGAKDTNEENNSQWREGETLAYFNANSFNGFYGSNGTGGYGTDTGGNFSFPSGGSQVYKIRFENDGEKGSSFYLYKLPSDDPSDWNDTENLLIKRVIGGSLNPNKDHILPFITPQNGGTLRFLGVRVE